MAIPLLASPQGGVAERSKNYCEASADREAGGGFPMKTNGKPPRLRQLRLLREIFLMTQPPLLAVMQGGESQFSCSSFTPSGGVPRGSTPSAPFKGCLRRYLLSPRSA